MMAEEEEDVIFDQAGLLTNRVKNVPEVQSDAMRVFCTVCLCGAFFGLGLCIAIPGPTLLDLQQQTGTDTEQIATIFTGRSIGYLAGSIVGGFLFDRINQPCLLTLSLLLTAVGTAGAPWCTNFIVLMGILAFQGISMGFLDTGGNVLCLYTWGRKSAPYMQTLHFAFGLGAFVAPLVAEPFLSPINGTMISNDTNVTMSPMLNLPPLDTAALVHKHLSGDASTGVKSDIQKINSDLNHVYKRDTAIDNKTPVNKSEEILPPPPHKPEHTGETAKGEYADGTKVKNKLKEAQQIKADPSPSPMHSPSPTTLAANISISNSSVLQTVGPFVTPVPKTSTTSATTTTTATTTSTTITSTTRKPSTTTSLPPPQPEPADNATDLPDASNTTTPSNQSIKNTIKNKFNNAMNQVKQITATVSDVLNNLSKVQFAYLAIAMFNLLVSFMFMILCCKGHRSLKAIKNQDIQPDYLVRKENKGFRVQILIMLAVFYFLYVGMEVTYGGLLMTFAVHYLQWTKTKGTLLTSVFWGSFATGRGLAIFLARCLNPPTMLIADLVLSCLALVGLVMGLESNHTIIWFCTAMLGVGLSSIFPTGITWAERYMHVTGKATSVFVVGSAIGEMCVPALTGFLFENKGPMWMLYILLACSLISVVLYIFMQNLASNMGDRYQRLSQVLANSSLTESTEIDLEMDSLPVSNHTEVFNAVDENSHAGRSKKKVTFNLNIPQGVRNGKKAGKGSILKGKGNGPKQD